MAVFFLLYICEFNFFYISLQQNLTIFMENGLRQYKGELYRKFCLKLKKDKLFAKFLVLEYYFRFYNNPENNIKMIYDYILNKDKKSIMYGSWFKNGGRGTYLDGTDKDILLSEFFKHYKV